ncbi:MAG: RnfABCDGE type electron transport complex subunit G [Kiritimatiellae bacterium]|nr:RnfABCDGE type electron transport complex subunit G [Kiritimatiellia bacterium]
MKKILSLVVSLTLISGVCAAVLAYVNEITKGPISEIKVKQEQAAVKAVLPSGVEKVEQSGDFYVGTDASGKVVGYAAKGMNGEGYGGDIVLMVGFQADKRTVVCYKTLSASETPGLGMNLNTPEFAGQFAGKDGSALSVKKDGGEIEAITSATITSRAVCRAIADAQKKLN